MKPNIDRLEKTLLEMVVIQDGKKCIPKDNIDKAIELVTTKFSDCFCEVSPHPTFPVFDFKVARAKRVFFEATIIE